MAVLTRTHTRTHVHSTFANPFLQCERCVQRAEGFHDQETCGCESGCYLTPCGHPLYYRDLCPSWGPVDGCTCQESGVRHG